MRGLNQPSLASLSLSHDCATQVVHGTARPLSDTDVPQQLKVCAPSAPPTHPTVTHRTQLLWPAERSARDYFFSYQAVDGHREAVVLPAEPDAADPDPDPSPGLASEPSV